MTLRYKVRRWWKGLRGSLFHKNDKDYWIAETIRGIYFNDRERINRAKRRLDSILGVPNGLGGQLLSEPLRQMVLLSRRMDEKYGEPSVLRD